MHAAFTVLQPGQDRGHTHPSLTATSLSITEDNFRTSFSLLVPLVPSSAAPTPGTRRKEGRQARFTIKDVNKTRERGTHTRTHTLQDRVIGNASARALAR